MNKPEPVPTSCDLEQIHRIGAIQPHGALVIADLESMRIERVSANIDRFLGHQADALLGHGLDSILSADELQRVRQGAIAAEPRRVLAPRQVALRNGTRLECVPHTADGALVLEFLVDNPSAQATWEEDDLRRQIISDLVNPATLPELAQLSADIIRRVNGFDRVMIYRFAEDHHGEVIAESTDRHDSYLGLHYPASDIPAPARRHFRLNVVRAIADIKADPVPILSADGVAGAADLTFSILRAVPTTHLTYLSNMGVAASMSVSLVSNNALWGLIACHHYEKREVPSQTLRFAELIGGTISALLQGIENRAQLSRAITAEQIAFAMEKEGRGGVALRDVVEGRAPELMHLLDAQGLVFRQSGKRLEHGKVPEPRLSYAPMRRVLQEGVAATDSVHDSLGRSDTDGVAGIGYMELSGDGQDYLVLLRESFEQVVNWAGKPETVEQRLADGSTRLNPRSSFAIWREERSDRSRPFDATDKEALRIIRRALFALNSLEREQAAIAAQKEAEAEEERLRLALLDAARKTSMGELASALAHELNQPLAAVSNYINACRQQLRNFDARIPEGFDDLMLDAVTEASRAADLVRRLRDFIAGGALQVELCDLRGAIRQGADLAMLASGSDRPTLVLDIADDLPRVWIDRIQIGQVILNLTVNAITAMKGSDERLLIIAAHVGEDAVIVTATDTGPGIADQMRPTLFEPFHSTGTTGMGIGLSLCRSIVEAHGGKIHAPQSDRGGVMEFTLPLTRAPEDELAAP